MNSFLYSLSIHLPPGHMLSMKSLPTEAHIRLSQYPIIYRYTPGESQRKKTTDYDTTFEISYQLKFLGEKLS